MWLQQKVAALLAFTNADSSVSSRGVACTSFSPNNSSLSQSDHPSGAIENASISASPLLK